MKATPQTPIGSGFGASSTATDVLAGIDLTGKVALVTGGYSGLGLEAVKALSGAGARVIVPARRPLEAETALDGIDGVDVAELDLADLESVKAIAAGLCARETHIDIAILSAGIMATPETKVGPGWESQFAVNHLGHYALINRIWPLLKGGARVVAVSSGGHAMTGIRWDDIHFDAGYDKWTAYGQSKTANVLFAVHLDQLGQRDGVRAFSLHPGAILTPLQRHLTNEEMVAAGWIHEDGSLADPTFKTTQQGAATKVWAATSPQLDGMGGVYCEDCDIAPLSNKDGEPGVRRHAIDPDEAKKLWRMSAELTQVDAFG